MREHFTPSKTPTAPWRTGLREGVLPILGLLGITAVLVGIFYLFLHIGESMEPVVPPHVDDGETVDPNPMRLAFVLLAFAAAFVFAYFAERSGQAGRTWPAFWLGYTGGTLLWQSVGEGSWHFSLPCEDFLICFTHLESSASPLVSRIMEEGEWYVITGAAVGITTCLVALWLNFFAARHTKARLCCSLLLYFGIGVIATGVGGL